AQLGCVAELEDTARRQARTRQEVSVGGTRRSGHRATCIQRRPSGRSAQRAHHAQLRLQRSRSRDTCIGSARRAAAATATGGGGRENSDRRADPLQRALSLENHLVRIYAVNGAYACDMRAPRAAVAITLATKTQNLKRSVMIVSLSL